MTQRDRVDRLLVDWIAEQDRRGATYLDDVLAVTQQTRQRPAWSFPERWIPVQLTLPRVVVPRAPAYLAILAILLALAVAAIALVGSPRQLPKPFGPASNGLLAYASPRGDIHLLDPTTGTSTVRFGGRDIDRMPRFSLDGTRLAFLRTANGASTVHVADAASGGSVAVTTEPLREVAEMAWSPDGRRIAVVAGSMGSRQIWLVPTDGKTAAVKVDTTLSVDNVSWRPPDGREIVFRGTSTPGTGFRLYLANGDGSNVRSLSPTAGADPADYAPAFSPDGQRLFYIRWNEEGGQLYAFDVAAGLEAEIGPKDGRSVAAFQVSPKGDRVSLAMPVRIDLGPLQIAVTHADGAGPVVNTGPEFSDLATFHRWSPDGTLILVWQPSEDLVMYLDPAGLGFESATLPTWPDVSDNDWQRLAPAD